VDQPELPLRHFQFRKGRPPRFPLRVNHYQNGRARIWMRFEPGYQFDIEQAPGVHAEVGFYPNWLEHELSDGWEFLLNLRDKPYGPEWSYEWCHFHWMLERGIAPGQRFQVEVTRPWYPSRPYYDGDWPDPGYEEPVIVQVEPWPLAKVAKAWEKAMQHLDMLYAPCYKVTP
jgi:hypothetical protein